MNTSPTTKMETKAHAKPSVSLLGADMEESMQYSHPVESIQQNFDKNILAIRQDFVAKTFGAHLPLRLKMEQEILSHFRLPGVHNSMLGLETIRGNDDVLDFPDMLRDPIAHEDAPMMSVHQVMETRLGLAEPA
eukprot:CAMPEP_0174228958 /NCGR_PEP_ID=MMETSP0417-20130205/48_1 /TAXON_ID=242541 /ORGANISM="Mayorella sp, Strain BSH-02190019" /LENGTH=133 /DNA_ID=CAMNT_0015306449 /DNA_START=18 /DNA_END=415 /DNA_ORIENTATION=-